jgi:hypothetical protein
LSRQLASAYGKLGNIDANTGDAQTGWDTDQFLTDPKEATLVAAVILKQGGLAPGAPPVQRCPCHAGAIGGCNAACRGLALPSLIATTTKSHRLPVCHAGIPKLCRYIRNCTRWVAAWKPYESRVIQGKGEAI